MVYIERRGYQRLALKGHMTDEELAADFAELDEKPARPPGANWRLPGRGARR